MLAPPRSAAEGGAASTFASLDPATGEEIATFPVDGPEAVAEAVGRARIAAAWWSQLGFAARRRHLGDAVKALTSRMDELADLVHSENGKPRDDALLEVVLAIEHLDWAARHAGSTLGPRRVSSGMLMVNHAATLEYQPLGVVGVIGPWNYPVYTPLGSISYALAAGNAIVYKPSEYTPAVGQWIADLFASAIPEMRLVQVVTGGGETGAALCRAGVDKLAFTGSARTGRRVMAACAETLTPVLMELGGKDAMIVDDDADLDAAAAAAVWGGLQNAGQACISVERVYVVDAVHDRFVEKVVERASQVRVAPDPNPEIGPITMPSQLDLIESHLSDALSRGARAVFGSSSSVRRPYVDPVVLVDVPPDALVMRDETFGPVLPIVRVKDAEEAVRLANDTTYGLAATVFGRRNAGDIARRLRSGMTAINNVIGFAAIPSLPFGGVGDSGFGRIHGEDGLREFTRAKAIARQRIALPLEVMIFGRPDRVMKAMRLATRLRHGR